MIQCNINNKYDDGLILLTDIPNILTVEDMDWNYGAEPLLLIRVSATTSAQTVIDGQCAIEFAGETITNVTKFENAINKNFWISRTSNAATAASIARALRNCQSLAADYNITSYNNVVKIKGKKPFYVDIQSNFFTYDTVLGGDLINLFYLQEYSDGQNMSVLTNAKIAIDIFDKDEEYVTTLEKTCSEYKTAFNISPVLTSIAEYGKTNSFSYLLNYTTVDGNYEQVTRPSETINYVSVGYMVNQMDSRGTLYADTPMIAQSISRGNANPSFSNHTLLYVYGDTIPLSFYKGNYSSGNITITYRDSAYNVIGSAITTTWQSVSSANKLYDAEILLAGSTEAASYFNQAFYIDISVINETLRYNVIKPTKAAETYTRLYFRNSYGGVSFIDLTGKRTETRNIDIKTYQKDIYDYHNLNENDVYENVLDKIYDNQVKYDVTAKSHIFEGDGRWIYNDILQSSKVWTVVNGEIYDVILDSVSVDELDNSNNLWEATVKYTYSMNPTIL